MKKSKFLAALCAAVMTAGMAGAFSGVQAADETLRIMELGDSITDGFNVTGGYRIPLWYLLHDAGYIDSYHMDFVGPNGWYIDGVCDTDHAGYSGYSIDDIPNQRTGLYSFIDWLMQEYPADIVMLQIGTNDILSSYELDTAENRLELLVDTILTYIPEDGMLFLATIPDMAADVTTYTDAYTVEDRQSRCPDQIRPGRRRTSLRGRLQEAGRALVHRADQLSGRHRARRNDGDHNRSHHSRNRNHSRNNNHGCGDHDHIGNGSHRCTGTAFGRYCDGSEARSEGCDRFAEASGGT